MATLPASAPPATWAQEERCSVTSVSLGTRDHDVIGNTHSTPSSFIANGHTAH